MNSISGRTPILVQVPDLDSVGCVVPFVGKHAELIGLAFGQGRLEQIFVGFGLHLQQIRPADLL